MRTGDLPSAEDALQRVLKQDGNDLLAYSLLARIYVTKGELVSAADRLKEVVARDARPVWAETMLGVICEAQHRVEEARLHYRRALALDNRAAVAANNLAWLTAETTEDVDRALALALSAHALLPQSAEVDDTLGWIYCRKGLADRAIGLLGTAVERRPESATYRYHLAVAYMKVDDRENARTCLKETMRLEPKSAAAGEAQKLLASLGG